jgi:tRNA threonylcarbamoyladenosine biosynthesis protein TsaE
MGRERRIITHSDQETIAFGAELTALYPEGGIFCFSGNLGSGKTTLIKGLVSALTDIDPNDVTSPTYTYLNIYESVTHFDLYRLENSDEFLALGLEDYLYSKGFVCIEWSERIKDILPSPVIHIDITPLEGSKREIICK